MVPKSFLNELLRSLVIRRFGAQVYFEGMKEQVSGLSTKTERR